MPETCPNGCHDGLPTVSALNLVVGRRRWNEEARKTARLDYIGVFKIPVQEAEPRSLP